MKNLFRNKLIYYAFATLFIVVFFISSLWYHHYTTTIDNDRFSSFMLSYSLYSQDMKELETEKIQQRYTGIHSTDIAKSKVFVATDNTTREFAIFETTGSQSTDNIQKVLGSYCSELLQKYESKNPKEYTRLKGYVIRRTRNYIILTISDSDGNGRHIIDYYLDKTHYDQRD